MTVLSDTMEDYLKGIYELERDEGPPVSTSAIASHLDVTQPTVTSMIESLADNGLVEREKYQGVELTPEGEAVALEILRHHRLLEAFLAEQLDYDWATVHEEADALEHHISEEFEQRISAVLGDPTTDPHGDPIPSADLERPTDNSTQTLADCDPEDRVEVIRVRDRDEADLSYLSEIGITPGTSLLVSDVAPFGMVTVLTGNGEQSLPEDIAGSIRVRTDSQGSSESSSGEVSDV